MDSPGDSSRLTFYRNRKAVFAEVKRGEKFDVRIDVHLLSRSRNAEQPCHHLNSPKPCFPYKSKTYENRKQGSETEEYPGWDEVIGV